MPKTVNIREFDVEKHKTWAVEDDDSGQILGLIFRRDDSGISTLVTAKNSVEIMEVDLAACAEHILEAYNVGNPSYRPEIH